MSKIIVFAFPVFLAAMALEWWWDRRQLRLGKVAHSRYALNDTINSLSLGQADSLILWGKLNQPIAQNAERRDL